jgi:hypothetical protein
MQKKTLNYGTIMFIMFTKREHKLKFYYANINKNDYRRG